MKKIRIAASILLVVVLVIVSVFVVWANNASPASDVALQALNTDSSVRVGLESGIYTFAPAEGTPSVGLIFYPGGRVDYRAYSPVLRMIAAQGYFVALVPAPLNLAFFDINAAARVQAQFPEVQAWVVGGHSLGGVAAVEYAKSHLTQIDGLVLFASYPADDALKNTDLKVLSIYGTRDIVPVEEFDGYKALLPEDAKYVVLEGGNHAQFGSYGPQAGDNEATISPEEQWEQTATATAKFLQGLPR
ncbi:MAG: alpha/beta hydrolase [Anaerolineales bacterium]|nr:alpha/beta hydrolase [Anaerolineales bacterium]